MPQRSFAPIAVTGKRLGLGLPDLAAILLVVGILVFLAEASRHLLDPIEDLKQTPISLDPGHLPEYALRTTLRMLAALGLSLVFTLLYATLAAKSRRAEQVLIPLLDILQSVPILGFISVTVVFFLSLAPGQELGAEFAAVFAIFTSQAWNMAFSFYQSLRTVPTDLDEVATSLRFPAWMRFWRLEVPLAMPGLVWNMMMSMSGGWFFVVASEAISVGKVQVALPGIGSYIAVAIQQESTAAIVWAVAAMLVVILLYDQLFFRPLVAWSDRYRVEQESYAQPPQSWVLRILSGSALARSATRPWSALFDWSIRGFRSRKTGRRTRSPAVPPSTWGGWVWGAVLVLILAAIAWKAADFFWGVLSLSELLRVLGLGLITALRVVVLIALASLLWVPVGVWVGLRPEVTRWVQPIAQILAAFPANLLFPFLVSLIVVYGLNADIWLSPLMILGTQWYILFNVIAGAATIPRDYLDVARSYRVTGWLWWKRLALPAVFPYYVTGAITAAGGSWNASIVAEYASWGKEVVIADGIGAYIAEATDRGDFHGIVLGILVMSALVLLTNWILWRPLYTYAERRYRLA